MHHVKGYTIPAVCTSYIAGMLYYLAYGNNGIYYDLQYSCIGFLCLCFLFAAKTALNKSFITELMGIDIVLLIYTKYARYVKGQFETTKHENWLDQYREFIHPKTWLLAAIIAIFHIGFVIFALHLFTPKNGTGTIKRSI